MSKKIISFDIGHTNMAMVCATISGKTKSVRVTHANMFDLKHIRCDDPECMFSREDCSAGHKTYHLVNKIKRHIEKSDYIITEQQPPLGLRDVEQSLLIHIRNQYIFKSPDHVRSINPRSMHAFFEMTHLNKAERSKRVVQLTKNYFKRSQSFRVMKSKPHLADACAYILYFTRNKL